MIHKHVKNSGFFSGNSSEVKSESLLSLSVELIELQAIKFV